MLNLVNGFNFCKNASNIGTLTYSRRFKKYMPMYTEIVKRRRGKLKKVDVKTEDSESKVEVIPDDLVPHPTTAEQALNVLKCIEKSYIDLNNIIQVYLHVWVKIDIRRISLRGNITLPYAVGPKVKVLAICEPEEVNLAIENGATYAGNDNLIDRIASGWTNFDVCLCTSIHMPKLMKVARILGPKKLMPNLKSGTLTTNLMESIRKLSSSKCVQYRGEPITKDDYNKLKLNNQRLNTSFQHNEHDIAVLQVPIGTTNDSPQHIITNTKHFIIELIKNRPTTVLQRRNIQFQWPPPRRDVNSILTDTINDEGGSTNSFILSVALGLVDQNNMIAQPIFINDLIF